MNPEIIRVFEHHVLNVGKPECFKQGHFNALVRFNEKHGNKYYTIGDRRIWFKSYVGVIQVGNVIIEVLPKADLSSGGGAVSKWQRALLEMLHTCRLIKVDSVAKAMLRLQHCSLMDIYYESFVGALEEIVFKGLIKKYRMNRTNLPYLKGKIDFARNLSLNLTHLERFFTEHHVYDYSHALNGILKAALLAVVQGSVHPMLQNRIRVLLLHFDGVEEYFPVESFYDHLKYDRKSIGYKDAITLARMILNNYAPDMSGGDENIVAVLFDMNKLFEEYVYRILLKESKQIGSQRVEIHYHRSSAFWGKSTLHPDILAIVDCAGEKQNYIIDTKWKIVSSSKPADEDLKQIFVYNRYFSSMHGFLLYPSIGQRNEGVKQFAAIPNQEGSTGGCETFFANLFDKSDHLDNRFAQDFISQMLGWKNSTHPMPND